MGSQDKRRWRRFLRSFLFAFRGLRYVLLNEQNMRIHVVTAACVLVLAFLLQIPLIHWLVLILVIGGVLSLEVVNTAIERIVDYISEDYHPHAGLIKDVAAAAVLVFSIIAVIIGILIFFPPLFDLFMNI